MEWFRGGSSEQTINCDTKSKGGIVGVSLNRGVVHRWILTSHERTAVTQAWINPFAPSESDEICHLASGVMSLEQESRTRSFDSLRKGKISTGNIHLKAPYQQ